MKCPLYDSVYCQSCEERAYGCKGDTASEIIEKIEQRCKEGKR